MEYIWFILFALLIFQMTKNEFFFIYFKNFSRTVVLEYYCTRWGVQTWGAGYQGSTTPTSSPLSTRGRSRPRWPLDMTYQSRPWGSVWTTTGRYCTCRQWGGGTWNSMSFLLCLLASQMIHIWITIFKSLWLLITMLSE